MTKPGNKLIWSESVTINLQLQHPILTVSPKLQITLNVLTMVCQYNLFHNSHFYMQVDAFMMSLVVVETFTQAQLCFTKAQPCFAHAQLSVGRLPSVDFRRSVFCRT